MDTKQLQTFVTLSRTLNYQRSADELQYAPSSLFKHIQLLEEELGTTLFFRKGRQLEMTREGREFLPTAERLLNEWNEVLHQAREQERVRALSIGGCELNISYSLRNLLQKFIAEYPEVHFNITTSPNADAPEFVKNGQADMCFYYSSAPRILKGFRGMILYSEPVFPSVHMDHPLLKKGSVAWQDLAAFPVLHSHDSCLFYRGYEQEMSARGLRPERAFFLGNIGLVADQARKEQAVTLISYSARDIMREEFGIVPLPLEDGPMRFWEGILYSQDAETNPSLRRMLRIASEYGRAQMKLHPDMLYAPPEPDTFFEEFV